MLKHPRLVFVPRMTELCKECGCNCNSCFTSTNSLDLHHECEELRSKLLKSQTHISQMEREFVDSKEYTETEVSKLQDELTKLRDRYDRLFESHKKLQKLNHNLEDKLLTIVVKFDAEKTALEAEVFRLDSELKEAKIIICDLEEECEKYRVDCNTAVQLLQCKPSTFVAHRLNTLPLDLQERVKSHLTGQQICELEESINPAPPSPKMIRVPMPTFPPTAMVYSINKNVEKTETPEPPKQDTVPMNLIARVLLHPDTNRKPRRVYICDKCRTDVMFQDQSTQTLSLLPGVDSGNAFLKNFVGPRPPQSAILIQPTVHHKPSGNHTHMEI